MAPAANNLPPASQLWCLLIAPITLHLPKLPMASARTRGLPPRMILDHSGGKCVHQIDISVRCIDEMQKVWWLQIQFYCQPPRRASLVFEQRCRINGLPDLVYYWPSLKGGKKRAPDFDWWVPLSSQITAHPTPYSHVPKLLFSCAQVPILMCRSPNWAQVCLLHLLFGSTYVYWLCKYKRDQRALA